MFLSKCINTIVVVRSGCSPSLSSAHCSDCRYFTNYKRTPYRVRVNPRCSSINRCFYASHSLERPHLYMLCSRRCSSAHCRACRCVINYQRTPYRARVNPTYLSINGCVYASYYLERPHLYMLCSRRCSSAHCKACRCFTNYKRTPYRARVNPTYSINRCFYASHYLERPHLYMLCLRSCSSAHCKACRCRPILLTSYIHCWLNRQLVTRCS